jgi:GNAT superfamily N-acetyltransferase
VSATLHISWCGNKDRAHEVATFFAGNVDPSYISHSELQGPRALSPSEWRPNLVDILGEEIEPRLAATTEAPGSDSKPIAIAEKAGVIVAVSLVTFEGSAPVPFAVVEDLIVDPSQRSHGVGKAIVDWIADEARSRKIGRLFLESGLTNERAHAFFEREGFHPTSVVMMRAL